MLKLCWGLDGCARWRLVTITIAITWSWDEFSKELNEFENKIGLGRNLQNNLKSSGLNASWGLDGCARWRKVTVTVATKFG